MSEEKPAKEAAGEEKLQGGPSCNLSNFDAAIGHYQDAWKLHEDLGYKNNEATNPYQKEDYHGAIAASVAVHSTPAILKKPEKLRKETDSDRALGDKVAQTVLESFKKLPKKRKPLEGGGKKEWVPLAGIVAQIGFDYSCIALGTGMKCLPFNKLPSVEGKVLHDWHAEVVALRSLNAFFLDEVNKIRGEGKFLNAPQRSEYLRALTRAERKDTVGRWHRDTPDYKYTIREGVKLHMYCSEAPCGDASMELTMAAQEDATPWEVATDADGGALPGRGGFGQLGIVRRKPSRPDAPECRSKSCSDKMAQKQMTSVLNSLAALTISPANAYLDTFTIPQSQYVHEAVHRCFSDKGRLKTIKDVTPSKGGYSFHPFKTLTTSQEFQYSRRSLASDGSAPKPSNIACSWTPHHDETIIGGILQGCKMTSPPKDESASATSRYKMWQSFEADKRSSHSQTKGVSFARIYRDVKSRKRLHARNQAKLAIRTIMMDGREWVKNEGPKAGDEDGRRESEQPLVMNDVHGLDIDPSSDDSDAVSDHATEEAMRREKHIARNHYIDRYPATSEIESDDYSVDMGADERYGLRSSNRG